MFKYLLSACVLFGAAVDAADSPWTRGNRIAISADGNPDAELALYDLRKDPLEHNNVAADPEYRELAEWFRKKLGSIVLGDGRSECDWKQKNVYTISNFAKGADDKKLDIPPALVPVLQR